MSYNDDLMHEQLTSMPLLTQVKEIIGHKDWYSLTESGSFKWDESITIMAGMISKEVGPVSPQELQEIIESSFAADALVRIGSKPLIDFLLEVDPDLILWTEGDPKWQKEKVNKTGLASRDGISYQFFSKNKQAGLKGMIDSLIDSAGSLVRVVVIDDKGKNLAAAASLQENFSSSQILITTQYLNLNHQLAGPEACLSHLQQLQAELATNDRLRLIVDLDGVLVDTDYVLQEVVSTKIAELITKKLSE